jgi:Tfp pilus assembly protein PilN
MMVERIEINLLPAEYRIHSKSFKLKREWIYPILTAILVSISLLFWTIIQKSQISDFHSQIAYMDEQIAVNKPIQNEINRLRQDKLTIQEKIRALELISVNREKWVRLMEELSTRLPNYTWLVSVKEENSIPPVLNIEGRTYSFPEVANYMSNLKESKFVTGVDLSNIEQIDTKTKVYKFTISASINPNASLNDTHVPDVSLRTENGTGQ